MITSTLNKLSGVNKRTQQTVFFDCLMHTCCNFMSEQNSASFVFGEKVKKHTQSTTALDALVHLIKQLYELNCNLEFGNIFNKSVNKSKTEEYIYIYFFTFISNKFNLRAIHCVFKMSPYIGRTTLLR